MDTQARSVALSSSLAQREENINADKAEKLVQKKAKDALEANKLFDQILGQIRTDRKTGEPTAQLGEFDAGVQTELENLFTEIGYSIKCSPGNDGYHEKWIHVTIKKLG